MAYFSPEYSTKINQTEKQQQLIDELQDLAKTQAGEKLTDFTLYALSIPEVAQNVGSDTIAKIYRLKGLLEEAKQLE